MRLNARGERSCSLLAGGTKLLDVLSTCLYDWILAE
jgi:hypothetical protein